MSKPSCEKDQKETELEFSIAPCLWRDSSQGKWVYGDYLCDKCYLLYLDECEKHLGNPEGS